MKLNQEMYAAVADDGEIAGTAEGELLCEDKSSLNFMLKAWEIDRSIFKIKKVKVVLVKEK